MSIMKGKTVLITGSSSGIGRETAFLFAKEGCNVIITYNKEKDNAVDTVKKCKDLGAKDSISIELDLTNNKSIQECVKKAVGKFKQIDILVNNAGAIAWKQLKSQTFEDIEMQIRVNYEGLVKITKECLPYIKDTIINIASGAGKTAYSGLSTYCGTKFAVRGFTQSLAQELKDIKVFAVNPGMTATRMTRFQGTPPEKVAQVVLNTAKGTYKKPSGSDIDVWDLI